MSDEDEELSEEFNNLFARKTAVLMALGPLLPVPAMTVLTMALTDILLMSAVTKQGALEAIDSLYTQLKDNVEFADKHNIGHWNNNTIQ